MDSADDCSNDSGHGHSHGDSGHGHSHGGKGHGHSHGGDSHGHSHNTAKASQAQIMQGKYPYSITLFLEWCESGHILCCLLISLAWRKSGKSKPGKYEIVHILKVYKSKRNWSLQILQ